ncbi:tyrosine recombinase [Proteiniclasticum sp. BAD-10]|uniref:Tyrosine recombinase n=1 Tax=Proteiniclasticum sediminis TaxID=2804028 RepID=A0A941HPD5_9CLOT|nr:tyrosine recombinase [Proteiniclasticum sediminis]MBR0574945.1 tyrosine recombinase [Proteiniclasticum sediminis]
MREDLLQAYLEELKREGKSENTLDAYRRDLVRLLAYLEEEALELEEFNEVEVSNFISYLLDQEMSRSTISRHLVSVRNFYKYLRKKNRIVEAPILFFELPEIKRNLPEALSVEEVERLLQAPDLSQLKGKRDKAILELLYGAGLKASELLDLTVRDVDLSRGYVSIRGKKNKERLIPIGSFAVASLREYLESRKDLVLGSSVLFPSQRGEKMTRQGLWKIFKDYAQSSGLDGKINLNSLRHSYAVHLLAGGADLTTLSTLLGHNDIKATAVYLKLVKNRKLKEVYDEAHPRA